MFSCIFRILDKIDIFILLNFFLFVFDVWIIQDSTGIDCYGWLYASSHLTKFLFL